MVMFTPLVRPPIWTPRPPTVPLTLSGNEQTPYVRRFNKEGDGLNPNEPLGKYSIGVWEATTNLNVNGNGGTNTTGVTDSGATNTRVTSGVVKFGSTVFQAVTANAGANEGAYEAISSGAASTQYTASVWVWAPTGSPTVRVAIYDDVSGKQASSAVTLTTVPQRITITATTGGGSTVFRTYVETDTQQNATFRWGGMQTEAQPLATPYAHSDGGTASRSAARVQIPNIRRYLNETQGWVFALLQAGWAANVASVPSNPGMIFAWRDSDNDRIEVYLRTSAGTQDLAMIRAAGGSFTQKDGAATLSFSAGDLIATCGRWTSSTIAISFNGGAFESGADTNIPAISATAADVGSRAGSSVHIDSSVLFLAMGKGTLTDANAAALNNIARNNRIDSRPEDLPGGCTFKWPPADGDVRRGLVAA